MTTAVRIAIDAHADVLSIPVKAVRRQEQRPFVWKRSNASNVRVPVTLGLKDNNYWEVRAGLAEGDEILTSDPDAETE
jgi:multidrug efflux pump subunit AcrA (membrane-fusion protein)